MPKIYRSMKSDNDKPLIGSNAQSLGVRVPEDIEPDAEGQVQPGIGGMSVSPSVRQLPPHRIPRRLRPRIQEAEGNNQLIVWSMGKGPFAAEAVAPKLQLRPDAQRSGHGLVEPDAPMPLDDYRSALASTQDAWSVDEE